MKASKYTDEGLGYLRTELVRDPSLLIKGLTEKIAESLPDEIKGIDLELPDLDFSQLRPVPNGDADSAIFLYKNLPAPLLGKWAYDPGFWVWYTMASPTAFSYAKQRFTKADPVDRILGKKKDRQALQRLWLGASLISGYSDNSKDNEKYISDLFSTQEVFESTIGRTLFREPRLVRAFVGTCQNRELKGDEIKALALRLKAVLGTRFILGLESAAIGIEVDNILTDMIATSKAKLKSPIDPPSFAPKKKTKTPIMIE